MVSGNTIPSHLVIMIEQLRAKCASDNEEAARKYVAENAVLESNRTEHIHNAISEIKNDYERKLEAHQIEFECESRIVNSIRDHHLDRRSRLQSEIDRNLEEITQIDNNLRDTASDTRNVKVGFVSRKSGIEVARDAELEKLNKEFEHAHAEIVSRRAARAETLAQEKLERESATEAAILQIRRLYLPSFSVTEAAPSSASSANGIPILEKVVKAELKKDTVAPVITLPSSIRTTNTVEQLNHINTEETLSEIDTGGEKQAATRDAEEALCENDAVTKKQTAAKDPEETLENGKEDAVNEKLAATKEHISQPTQSGEPVIADARSGTVGDTEDDSDDKPLVVKEVRRRLPARDSRAASGIYVFSSVVAGDLGDIQQTDTFATQDGVYISPDCMKGVPVAKIVEGDNYWEDSWQRLADWSTVNDDRPNLDIQFLDTCSIHPNQLLAKKHIGITGLLVNRNPRYLRQILDDIKEYKETDPVKWLRQRLAELISKDLLADESSVFRLKKTLQRFREEDPGFLNLKVKAQGTPTYHQKSKGNTRKDVENAEPSGVRGKRKGSHVFQSSSDRPRKRFNDSVYGVLDDDDNLTMKSRKPGAGSNPEVPVLDLSAFRDVPQSELPGAPGTGGSLSFALETIVVKGNSWSATMHPGMRLISPGEDFIIACDLENNEKWKLLPNITLSPKDIKKMTLGPYKMGASWVKIWQGVLEARFVFKHVEDGARFAEALYKGNKQMGITPDVKNCLRQYGYVFA